MLVAGELIALIVLVLSSGAEEQEIGLMNDRTVIAALSQQQQQQPITADPGLSITSSIHRSMHSLQL